MSHAFPLVLSFFLGSFFGILVMGLVSANRLWEDEDE